MQLREIKKWIESLPEEFLNFEVVTAEQGMLSESDLYYKLDRPIINLAVDEDSKEILFLNSNEDTADN